MAAVLASSSPLIIDEARAASTEDLTAVGIMEAAVAEDLGDDLEPSPLIVDELNSLGFAIGFPVGSFREQFAANEARLVMHDLRRPDEGVLASAPPPDLDAAEVFLLAVDDEAQRLIAPAGVGNITTTHLPCNPDLHKLAFFDYRQDPDTGAWSITRDAGFPMPCSGIHPFAAVRAAIYEANGRRKLLLAGTHLTEAWRFSIAALGLAHNVGQPLLIRQLDLEKLYAAGGDLDPDVLDWEIDLRYAGCGRWESSESILLARLGPDLLTYCWDTRPVIKGVGAQGYVVRIPLGDDDMPDTLKRTPIVPDPANPAGVPTIDPPTPEFDPPPPNTERIVQACAVAGGPLIPPTGFNFVACAQAAAAEASRQGMAAVDWVVNSFIPSLGVPDPPPLPDPSAPPDTPPVDQGNPTGSKFIANPVVRRTPTLPGTVFPFVDPLSSRLLLLTANDVNGNAVWVFDPIGERFIGIIAPGGTHSQELARTAAGFDALRGRAYLFTAKGILAAPTRADPLPAGKVHPVYGDSVYKTAWRRIAVAPRAHRLVIPMIEQRDFPGGYAIVDDDVPDPRLVDPSNPDNLTAQIDEEPGLTEVDASGAAEASGAHVVVVGGVPRAVNQLEPLCEPLDVMPAQARERKFFDGQCLADQVLSTGKREFFLAITEIGVGTSTGAVAEASGFTASDDATDRDVRNIGSCGATSANGLWGGADNLFDEITPNEFDDTTPDDFPLAPALAACDPGQDGAARLLGDDLRNGTSGGEDRDGPDQNGIRDFEDADGFPVPTSACEDSTGRPTSDSLESGSNGSPKSALFASSVSCDAMNNRADGSASSVGIGFPDPTAPVLAVARTSSSTNAEPGAEGQVTVATGRAEGVSVGPLRIARVETSARVRAKGRTGTTATHFTRLWCGVEVTGIGQHLKQDECVDPTTGKLRVVDPTTGNSVTDPATGAPAEVPIVDVIDDLNQALGKVRITIPLVETTATRGGYEAVVTKDASVRAADRTVNADDAVTVPGVQITIYNDGEEGLNRWIVQLAGVHAESRYGITRIPDPGTFEFDEVVLSSLSEMERAFYDPVRRRPGQSYLETIDGGEPVAAVGPVDPDSDDPLRYFRDILRWLINNWREALLLFLVFSILATPVYLGARRRAFERELAL